jgi:hypothetical protein
LFCSGLVQSTSLFFTLGDWISREGQKYHRLGGRTNWQSDFFAGQLVGPLGSWTSSLTSWLDCSELTSTRRSLAADQLDGLLGARFFANQLVGLFVASSSTTLGLTS